MGTYSYSVLKLSYDHFWQFRCEHLLLHPLQCLVFSPGSLHHIVLFFFVYTFSVSLFLEAICFPGTIACMTFTWKNRKEKNRRRREEKHTESVQLRQIQVFNCQCCHGAVHSTTVTRRRTESERLREKKTRIKEKEILLAASLCLCCHGRVKQTQLRNYNPNRGHREGRERGMEGRGRGKQCLYSPVNQCC